MNCMIFFRSEYIVSNMAKYFNNSILSLKKRHIYEYILSKYTYNSYYRINVPDFLVE